MLFTTEDFDWFYEENEGDIRFDRKLIYKKKTFFFEVERGTQPIDTIEKKIKNYSHLQGSFNVIFTVQDYQDAHRFKSSQSQGEKILELLSKYKRGNQFLVTPHKAFLSDPLGGRLISPLDTIHSLNSL